MPNYFVRKWFEDDLTFRLSDGTEAESVFLGTSELLSLPVLRDLGLYA